MESAFHIASTTSTASTTLSATSTTSIDMAAMNNIVPSFSLSRPSSPPSNEKRLYRCPVCSKSFLRLEHSNRHILIHTGEKPFICSYPGCPKRFSRSDELARHSRTHGDLAFDLHNNDLHTGVTPSSSSSSSFSFSSSSFSSTSSSYSPTSPSALSSPPFPSSNYNTSVSAPYTASINSTAFTLPSDIDYAPLSSSPLPSQPGQPSIHSTGFAALVSDPYDWNNPTSPTTPTLATPSPSLSPSINGSSSPSTSAVSAYSPVSLSSLHLTSSGGVCTPLDPSQVQQPQQLQHQQQQQSSYPHVMLMSTYSMVQQQQQTIASPVSDDTIPNTATTTTNHFKRFSAPLLSMNAGNNTGMAGDADAAATGPTWDINNARRHASMPAIMEQSFFAGPMPSSSSSQDLSATVDADGMPRKPHVCPWPNCNKTFTRSAHLTRHVRAHGGEKPYSCPHEGCGKRFSRSDVLKEHIRIHDGNRVRKRRVRGSSDSNSSSSSSHQASAAAVAAAAAAKRNSIAATTSLAAAAEQSTAQLFAIPPPLTCRAPNGMGTMPNPAFPVSSFRSCEAQPSPDMHPYAHYQPQASLSPREPSLSSSPPYIHDSCSQGTTGSGAVATTMSIQPNSSFNALLGMESVAHFDRSGSSWQHQQQQQVTQRGAAVVSGSYSATPYQHHHNHHHQHQQQDGSYPVAAAYSNMPQTATHYSSSSPLSNHGPSHSSSNNNNNQPMTLATMAAVASMEADLMGLQQNWSSVPSQQQQQQPPRYESTQYAPSYYSQQAM